MTRIKTTLITLLAAAALAPGVAAADPDWRRGEGRDRYDQPHQGGRGESYSYWKRGGYDRGNVRWTRLGNVGTHVHDAEDFLEVRTRQRFEQLALVAQGHPIRMDAVEIQFEDGRKYRIDVRETLRPGESITLDVPSYSPISMVVLDYGNRGRMFRDRETASVEVIGLRSSFRDRTHDRNFERRTDRVRGDRRYNTRDRLDNRFQMRGDVYIRVRT